MRPSAWRLVVLPTRAGVLIMQRRETRGAHRTGIDADMGREILLSCQDIEL